MANKKKTLDDFLKQGKKPSTKGKKAPPDYDVITPGMGYTKPTKNNPPKKIKRGPVNIKLRGATPADVKRSGKR